MRTNTQVKFRLSFVELLVVSVVVQAAKTAFLHYANSSSRGGQICWLKLYPDQEAAMTSCRCGPLCPPTRTVAASCLVRPAGRQLPAGTGQSGPGSGCENFL